MMLLSVTLAAGVALAVGLHGDESSAATRLSSTETLTAKKIEGAKRKLNLGEKLKIDRGPTEEPPPKPEPPPPPPPSVPDAGQDNAQPVEEHRSEPAPEPQPTPPPPEPAPIPNYWPKPSNKEISNAKEPRYFNPNPGADMTLTVPALGLYDVPVYTSDGPQALDASLLHVPETSFPWDEGAQRNVYIAGHYLGWPGTKSRLIFYNLDQLSKGDEVILKDREDRAYRYRVSESFMAGPDESWVMGQEVGRDMVTLQTCIPPTFENRLIVQADRT